MNSGLQVLATISATQRHNMSTDQLLEGYVRAQRRLAQITSAQLPADVTEVASNSVRGYQKELRERLERIASRTHDNEVQGKVLWEVRIASLLS